MRIAYIFTTFPKLSEQFFLREVLELQRQGVELDIFSVFGGADHSEAGSVVCMHFKDWLRLLVELLYWLGCRPLIVLKALYKLLPIGYGSWTNYGENLLGVAFAFCFARKLRAGGYTSIHGTWATAPGMVVYLTDQLTGVGYTLEAHAYDVFRDGGDAFLVDKLAQARAVRSSTEATAAELRQRLEAVERNASRQLPEIHCIRRGLADVPNYEPSSCLQEPKSESRLRVISVGRLIEKKGYLKQLEIYKCWLDQGLEFEAMIVGEGPLLKTLKAAIKELGLSSYVQLLGKLEYSQVSKLYAQSSLFIFTGVVSGSGDRDGFPNVIGEAMAHSLPVFTTDVSGTTEGVLDGVRGTVIDLSDLQRTAQHILAVMQEPEKLEPMTRAAYDWVIADFQVKANVRKLRQALWGV